MRRLRAFITQIREERREHGWRGLVRRRGWKLVLLVVAVYLVRDVVLYILIPLAIVSGILSR